MKAKKRQDDNYLDKVPHILREKWEVTEDGSVEITVENTGFYNTLAQKLFKRPRFSFIRLDEYGSCVWQEIDGQKNIYEIGQILRSSHKGAEEKLYERLSAFFGILESNGYVSLADGEKKGRVHTPAQVQGTAGKPRRRKR